jgi:hypothetical protein
VSHSSWAEQDILERFLDRVKKETVQSGDVIFWALSQRDSVIIQRFTEGVYSHAGILWVDEEGKIWILDVIPGEGLQRSSLENHFVKDRSDLIELALVRYKGPLDREEITRRLKEFWSRKNQIKFDHSLALEEGQDYAALINGKVLSLYCTEFVYRVYEGIFSGPPFFENDYPKVYQEKDAFDFISADIQVAYELERLMGIRPEEQFEKWLTSHKSQVIISANGMLRGGGFTVLFEVQDRERQKEP